MMLLLFTGFVGAVFAQGPKWVTNAKKAVFSVVTFDKENKLLKTSNGFFISEKGIGVSDFALFKGAHRAVVIDSDGKEHNVESILGADDTYDVVKFRVAMQGGKKSSYLATSTAVPVVGTEVYVLPYSIDKNRSCYPGKINKVDSIRDNYLYYTLDMRVMDNLASCPTINTKGEVVGMLQKNYDSKKTMIAHVIDVNFIKSLKVGALSFSDVSLKDIHIKKGLPENEDEALVYLFVSESMLNSSSYKELVLDFIKEYPNNKDGYIRLATYQLANAKTAKDIDEVKNNLDKAYRVSEDKAEALFSIVKLICSNQQIDVIEGDKDWTLNVALDKINKAIEMQPEPVYLLAKAEILASLKRFDESIEYYDKVNQSNIASAQSFYAASQVQKEKGADDEVVLALLDNCINKLSKPYNYAASPYLLDRALLLIGMGRSRDALKDFNEYYYAVEGNVNGNFYFLRAQVSFDGRLFQQALDDIDMAIRQEPNNSAYLVYSTSIHLRVGKYNEALTLIDKALTIDPNNGEAHRLKGVAYIQLKDKKKACESLSRAKELGDTVVDKLIQENCK